MLTLLLACIHPAVDTEHTESVADLVEVEDVSWTLSEEVQTVATLSFTTSESREVTIRHGQWSTTSSGIDHEVLVLGLPAALDTVVLVELDGEVLHEEVILTGSVPATIPALTRTGGIEAAPPFLLMPVSGATNTVIIVDAWGQVVWYHVVETGRALMRASALADGSGVVVSLAMGGDDDTTGLVYWLDWHGEVVAEVEVEGLRMDALALPDGSVAGITAVTAPDYAAYGDALVEISSDGGVQEIWNSWQAMDPEREDAGSIEEGLDWTHASAIEYDPTEEDYYLTLGYLSSLAKIDRTSGELEWELFGDHSELEVEGEAMRGMHQIDLTEDGLLVFNNGTPERGYSRVVEYALDEEAGTASEIWDFIPEPPLWVYIKGDVHRLDSGDTLAIWSSSGQAQIASPEGEVSWQLDIELGHVMLYSEVLDKLGS